ncbi:hypothetical protein M422DRAFT_50239 [Sphaerobolus stellatus SS14]|uniref:Unplaced genomic scaffold SPHSTscaffold_90, whole genome shotgun sequence n=1 Tax=Sphaerobolus stellatus (strain SS14) TaxID=990650 RepID=A0A0C9U4S9_SPHS4|nr:hypothetical protein M422DRAFT_50239 [Sphaerobolus stellatus SS14]
MLSSIVAHVSTLRLHLQSTHKGNYIKWVKDTPNAVNKLPQFLASQRESANKKAEMDQQSTLTEHFKKAKPTERFIPYSDTFLPIQALEHPKFHKMIDITSRAKNGIKVQILKQKVTRAHIIRMFRKYLKDLKKRLKGSSVKGKISFTCHAWQASNADAYFAVTAHWIEIAPLKWELQAAIIGFTRMNYSHHGVRLGQALFKIILRIDVVEKSSPHVHTVHLIDLKQDELVKKFLLLPSHMTMHITEFTLHRAETIKQHLLDVTAIVFPNLENFGCESIKNSCQV